MNIYIGWDGREKDAYNACVNSINQNCKIAYPIYPLVQSELRRKGYYYRDPNEAGSTEFTYSRFLVPALQNYSGWAMFMDCDMIVNRDLDELFALADEKYAVMCVQHDYVPKDSMKMDGQKQVNYPKKNWSSVMLMNCSHRAFSRLSVSDANTQSGAYLHRFEWVETEKQIGSLPIEWNYLVGEYDYVEPLPALLHYTLGVPSMEGWENSDWADVFWKYHESAPMSA